ncbi:MAG: hypothetical protein SH848_21995 [Saprospiraceae bacterium]|nr:hypothetical protein [Saprospiraceae bacterium]MDZ4706617.1 hypothetical protein [Saprospiraceae bacterium]
MVNEQNETGEDCLMIAHDDRFNNFSIVPGSSIIIPFEFLLFNDLVAPGAGADISYDEGNTDGAEFISVTAIDTDMNMEADAFEITALPIITNQEIVLFRYQLEGCNEDCSDAIVDLQIINSSLAPACSGLVLVTISYAMVTLKHSLPE